MHWQSLAVLYAVGAVAMLGFIRLMVYFSSSSDSTVMQEWAAAASNGSSSAPGQHLPLSAAGPPCGNGTHVPTALPSSVLQVLVLYMQASHPQL
jgi:hypothetical protein